MFGLNESLHYYIYPHYVDMNKGMESLCELVRAEKKARLLSGDVFLFFPKRRDRVKILRWDTDGFILYNKRLEAGSFQLPRFRPEEGMNQLDWNTFFMIIRGIPLAGGGRTSRRFKL